MELPNDQIGISDVIAWRECPRRMSFSMKRWTEEGDPPEATNESNAYGSAIHEVFRLIEVEGLTDDEAVQRAFDQFGGYLWPHDIVRMKKDLKTYHERDPLGVRLIGAEIEARVPLIEVGGKMVYFRGQIDRLYQHLYDPGVFIHRDYKSSKWPKTSAEVNEDLQMWAYNWLIHEFWPECEDLRQVYDQLEAGEIMTRKSQPQREQIKEWLQHQVIAIINDDPANGQGDGLLKPKMNQWCPWCPLMESCKVVPQLSKFAADRVAALSENNNLDRERIEEYVAGLDDATTARKMLERYEKTVKTLVKELPEEEREELGFKTYQRRNVVWSSDALEQIHEMLGDEFFSMASLSKGRIEEYLAGDPRLERVLDLGRKEPGPVILSRKKAA
jgi:hypothetical protein